MAENRRDAVARLAAIGVGVSGLSMSGAEGAKEVPVVNPRLFQFAGGNRGTWTVTEMRAVRGEPLPKVARMEIVDGSAATSGAVWVLRGVTSNERYVTRGEKQALAAKQAGLGRSEATHSAVIPIRKNAQWWAMTQDDRRAVLEERSHHIEIGLRYLPAIARRLHHCRDLSASEPFDFITLFDYAKDQAKAFEDLVAALRATEEWKYVEREVDIRLVREPRG